jgi:hypothetical protein
VDRPTGGPSEPDERIDDPHGVPDAPPTLPSRTAFLLAFLSIVLAGAFGGVIGYGLGDLAAEGDPGVAPLLWAVAGAGIGAGGVGVVAVLVLRAQAEWRRVPPRDPPPTP